VKIGDNQTSDLALPCERADMARTGGPSWSANSPR
jgi:hypothetical protein